MLGIKSRNPEYILRQDAWEVCRDCYAGEDHIKRLGVKYLPATPAMTYDGMGHGQEGRNRYDQYLDRAVFHNYVFEATKKMVGLMHSKPANIVLPGKLEFMRSNATTLQESLQALLRRISVEQLITGRVGLLLDLPAESMGEVLPRITVYGAEKIINWSYNMDDRSYDLVVLDESGYRRREIFEWENFAQYRVLKSGDLGESRGLYHNMVFDGDEQVTSKVVPSIRGRKVRKIPFTIINTNDVSPQTDSPPLLGVAKSALTSYKGEADYRYTLFMMSQDTLVIVGAYTDDLRDGKARIGAGANMILPLGGDAKFIGITGNGIGEQRKAIENDRLIADEKALQLIGSRTGDRESGSALHIKTAAQTATLNQLVSTAAGGLEQILKEAATWVGADPEEVSIRPNTDFISDPLSGPDLLMLMNSKAMGAPLSRESMHALMVSKKMTSKSYEQEMRALNSEEELYLVGEEEDAG